MYDLDMLLNHDFFYYDDQNQWTNPIKIINFIVFQICKKIS